MDYKDTVDFLYQSLPMYQRTGGAAYKANLDNTLALDSALNYPHKKFKSIHIAGTNGKGSVSHMLASVLQTAGYKTGLYTSPHLLDFRERIRINGKMISEEFVVDFIQRIKSLIEKLSPSFFEMTVAMAFDHFAKENVDIAIIETGMGGRLDSTNIVLPEVSVITSVSMDHTEFLGKTIKLIASEKGGIIKPGIPVILGNNPPEVINVIKKIAEDRQADLTIASEIREFKSKTSSLDMLSLFYYTNRETNLKETIKSDLTGAYQRENIPIVLSTIELLKRKSWKISGENIAQGLISVKKTTSLRGRWDILGTNPRIICDTGHNIAGVEYIMKELNEVPASDLHIVWGMNRDKDHEGIMQLLPPEARYYFTRASIPRAMPVEQLAEIAEKKGLTGSPYPTVREAYYSALKKARPEDTVFIGGSSFVVADLFYELNRNINKRNAAE